MCRHGSGYRPDGQGQCIEITKKCNHSLYIQFSPCLLVIVNPLAVAGRWSILMTIHLPMFCCSSHSPDTCPNPLSSTSFSQHLLGLPLFFWHPLFLVVLISPVFDVFYVCPKYVNFCFLMKFVIITLYIQCILLRIDKHNYICDFDYV